MMHSSSETRQPFGKKLLGLAKDGSIGSAAVVFLIYICGYLSLRFRLLLLGAAMDFGAFSERVFYAGAMFLIYTALTLSSVLLIVLLPALGIRLISRWLWFKRMRKSAHDPGLATNDPGLAERTTSAISRMIRAAPYECCLTTLVLGFAFVQFFLRKILSFQAILLHPSGLSGVFDFLVRACVLDKEAYYVLLLLALVLASGLFILLRKNMPNTLASKWLLRILFFGICVQAAFIPIHHGGLVVAQSFSRLMRIKGEALPAGKKAWLIWEGETFLSILLKDSTKAGVSRKMMITTKELAAPMESGGSDPLDSLLSIDPSF